MHARFHYQNNSRSNPHLAPYISSSPSQKKTPTFSSSKCLLLVLALLVILSLIIFIYIDQRLTLVTKVLFPYDFDDQMFLDSSNFCPDDYCWPRIYLIGAAKSGTTSLWSVLRSKASRGLCVPEAIDGDPKWYRKEGTFFSVDSHFYSNFTPKEEAKVRYRRRYPKTNCQGPSSDSFLDATPSYLSNPRAAIRMKATYKDFLTHNIRFVAVLRNPSDRDLSWYKVGEGLKSDSWWEEKLNTCGASETANARCYDDSVKEEINKWDLCISKVLKLPCSYKHMSSITSIKNNTIGNPNLTSNLRLDESSSCFNKIVSNEDQIQDIYSKCYQSSRLSHGIYISQLLFWINEWGRDKLFIIKTDDLVADSKANLVRIAKHLNLKLNLTGWSGMPKENDTSKKKFFLNFTPFCSTMETLEIFYKPYNDMLVAHLRKTSKRAPHSEAFFKDLGQINFSACIPDKSK